MSVVQYPKQLTGTVDIKPNLRYMVSTANLATITTPGYLNDTNKIDATPLSNGDVIFALYNYNVQSSAGTFGIFIVSISVTTGITLTAWVDSGNVLLPVSDGDFAVFNGTSGQIKDAGYAPSSIAPYVVMSPGGVTLNHVPRFNNVNGTLADSGILYTNLMILNGTNTMASGSSIVASKVNGTESGGLVIANGVAGKITTSALTTAGGASYPITWSNSFLTATSVVLITWAGGTNTIADISFACVPGAGGAVLTIFNNTAATPLDGTIMISYLVM